MSPFPWSDLVIIAGLIVLNGLFSMSELAIVSARPARLRKMSEDGSKGAKAALALAANCSGEHPFAAKFRLYQSGHWPLGLYDGVFHIL